MYKERLGELGLFNLEKMRLRGFLIPVYEESVQRGWRQALLTGAQSSVLSDRIDNNGHKLKHRMFHLKIRKHLLWGWVSTVTGCPEAVESPSLQILKNCLDKILCICKWPCFAGWCGPDDFQTSLQVSTALWFRWIYMAQEEKLTFKSMMQTHPECTFVYPKIRGKLTVTLYTLLPLHQIER